MKSVSRIKNNNGVVKKFPKGITLSICYGYDISLCLLGVDRKIVADLIFTKDKDSYTYRYKETPTIKNSKVIKDYLKTNASECYYLLKELNS